MKKPTVICYLDAKTVKLLLSFFEQPVTKEELINRMKMCHVCSPSFGEISVYTDDDAKLHERDGLHVRFTLSQYYKDNGDKISFMNKSHWAPIK